MKENYTFSVLLNKLSNIKGIYVLLLAISMLFTINKVQAQCSMTINMNDSYGDGWNGGYLTVYFDSVSQGTYYASSSGSTAYVTIPAGQTMDLQYTSGSWEGENTYNVVIGGSTVFSDGTYPSTGTVYSYS